jgi:transposase
MTIKDVNVPHTAASGHPRGVDLGLDKFAATSDGELIERPRFLSTLHRKRSTELTPKSEIAATQA